MPNMEVEYIYVFVESKKILNGMNADYMKDWRERRRLVTGQSCVGG